MYVDNALRALSEVLKRRKKFLRFLVLTKPEHGNIMEKLIRGQKAGGAFMGYVFSYNIFLHLALILLLTKVLGILMRKLGLPQVVGALIAGILIGVSGIIENTSELKPFAEIGVVMIMFTAGMETNFKELKKNGVASVLITSLGVIVPLAVGFGVSWIIPGLELKERFFFGVILAATSVGITVAVLKEIGKIHGKVGASIVTAAVLDDIIGIVILAFATGDVDSGTWGYKIVDLFGDPAKVSSGVQVLINVVLFFVIAIAFGIAIHFIFKFLSKKFPHTRRLSIFGLATAFLFAWFSEELFGVAAITGAFVAGMMMSNMKQTDYVERRIDMSAYMLFSPIFFANIGICLDYKSLVDNFGWTVILFSLAFVICGMAAKLVGCGAGGLICKYKPHESLEVGLGMMVRGEVCLIVAQKGIEEGIMSAEYLPAVILLVIMSSLLTPIFLKLTFKKFPTEDEVEGKYETPASAVATNIIKENLEKDIPICDDRINTENNDAEIERLGGEKSADADFDKNRGEGND